MWDYCTKGSGIFTAHHVMEERAEPWSRMCERFIVIDKVSRPTISCRERLVAVWGLLIKTLMEDSLQKRTLLDDDQLFIN